MVHVGLDETFDLGACRARRDHYIVRHTRVLAGKGRSKEDCQARGVHAVYMDFVDQVSVFSPAVNGGAP